MTPPRPARLPRHSFVMVAPTTSLYCHGCTSHDNPGGGGWFDEEAEVWDREDRLVAQSRQIARLGRGA